MSVLARVGAVGTAGTTNMQYDNLTESTYSYDSMIAIVVIDMRLPSAHTNQREGGPNLWFFFTQSTPQQQ